MVSRITPAALARALVHADPDGIGRMCHIKLMRAVTGALAVRQTDQATLTPDTGDINRALRIVAIQAREAARMGHMPAQGAIDLKAVADAAATLASLSWAACEASRDAGNHLHDVIGNLQVIGHALEVHYLREPESAAAMQRAEQDERSKAMREEAA